MELLISVLCALIVAIGSFYIVCFIIRLWTGCTWPEASVRLYNFCNGKATYSFSNDPGFTDEIVDNIHRVLGDKRFQRWMNLSNTTVSVPFLQFGESGGLPFIAISLFYDNENEKEILQKILTNVVQKYLKVYGYPTKFIVNWSERSDLKLPLLTFKYAHSQREERILDINMNCRQEILNLQNLPLSDDEDTEELD